MKNIWTKNKKWSSSSQKDGNYETERQDFWQFLKHINWFSPVLPTGKAYKPFLFDSQIHKINPKYETKHTYTNIKHEFLRC